MRAETPQQSLAAIFLGPKLPLELRQITLPNTLGAGEVLVRITCCTLCGSDLSTLLGHRKEPTPCILGHEILGTVAAIGPERMVDLRGRVLKLGDRIVWSVAASCDRCRNCLRGMPQKCTFLKKYGHQQLSNEWQLSGGLAEYCHLMPGTKLLVVDSQLTDATLCPASCATSTVAAAFRTANCQPGPRVLILGAGLLGLTAAAMAQEQGAELVTVCDTSCTRLELAERFGADATILWDDFDTRSDSPKYDLVFEMSGDVRAVEAALRVAAVGASVLLVGSVRPTPLVEFKPESLVRRMLSIHGIHNYRPADLVNAVDFLDIAAGKYPFSEIVSLEFALANVNSVLSHPGLKNAIRIAIKPS